MNLPSEPRAATHGPLPVDRAAATASAGGQYLSFVLSGEEYALDILQVQEIKGLAKVTQVPNAPRYLRGVMNLRGTVVPVIDLRTLFGLAAGEDGTSVTIVIDVAGRIAGLVADAVSDVLDIAPDAVAPPPDLGGSDGGYLSGLAKVADRLVMLLDVERLLAGGSRAGLAA